MKGRKRILALGLTLAMVLSLLCVPGMAAGTEEESIPEGNQAEGAWVYEVVQAAMGGPGGGPGGPPPGGMGGDPGAGGGAQTISSNNKNDDVYVLFPEGVTTFSPRMIYDYNSTSGWSIPSSVTAIADGTFLSCPPACWTASTRSASRSWRTTSTRSLP